MLGHGAAPENGGTEEDDWAGCGIFPGKLVANRGWCSAWAPKA
ncbi:MAG: high-potential iron-sulfur protein [Pseudomonadota bacterium]